MPKLVVITQGLGELSHELSGELISIGRADGNTFQIPEASVSGRHCEVQLRGREVYVRDLDSTNGTWLMGERISHGMLKLGQSLRLGHVELRLRSSTPWSVHGVQPATPATPVAGETPATPAAATGPRKHQVLFVDDNVAFLETLKNLFNILARGSWEIHCAHSATDALTLLARKPVDLAVLDIDMPQISGVQLLEILQRRYPALKKAMLSANPSEDLRAACIDGGAELFIEKPVSPERLKAVFKVLNELVAWPSQAEGFSGMLRKVSLADVVQIQCLMRNSTTLEIRNHELRGRIHIENGAIVHANAGILTGEWALYQLLSLSGGEFQTLSFEAPAERTVSGRWESLLMEAARLRDETAVIQCQPDSPAPRPRQLIGG